METSKAVIQTTSSHCTWIAKTMVEHLRASLTIRPANCLGQRAGRSVHCTEGWKPASQEPPELPPESPTENPLSRVVDWDGDFHRYREDAIVRRLAGRSGRAGRRICRPTEVVPRKHKPFVFEMETRGFFVLGMVDGGAWFKVSGSRFKVGNQQP